MQVRLWAAVAMDSQSSGRDGTLRLHGRQDNTRLLVVCWFLENESGQGLDTHCHSSQSDRQISLTLVCAVRAARGTASCPGTQIQALGGSGTQ